MSNFAGNLACVTQRIEQACQEHHRPKPLLLAVSKTRSSDELRAAYELGLRAFGENYVQEAAAKQAELQDLAIEWHFIGPIQSNKARAIAEQFDWVHSVDRLKVAQKLSSARSGPPLNICLQVNIDAAASKAGVLPDDLSELMAQCQALPNVRIRGLMAIPDAAQGFAAQCRPLAQLAECFAQCQQTFPDLPLDTLSMGMSGDLEAAIAAGSTMVRIGTDLFGPRRAANG